MGIPDDELARRRAAWQAPVHPYRRGYTRLYNLHYRPGYGSLVCQLELVEE